MQVQLAQQQNLGVDLTGTMNSWCRQWCLPQHHGHGDVVTGSTMFRYVAYVM